MSPPNAPRCGWVKHTHRVGAVYRAFGLCGLGKSENERTHGVG